MMSKQQQRILWQALFGLILIVISLKYFPLFLAVVNQENQRANGPVILFFNDAEPCECMQELVAQADEQIANWPAESRANIPIVRIGMKQRTDLEVEYKIFRAPCLVLIDQQNQVVWRQDYPLIKDGPFRLPELEAAISNLDLP